MTFLSSSTILYTVSVLQNSARSEMHARWWYQLRTRVVPSWLQQGQVKCSQRTATKTTGNRSVLLASKRGSESPGPIRKATDSRSVLPASKRGSGSQGSITKATENRSVLPISRRGSKSQAIITNAIENHSVLPASKRGSESRGPITKAAENHAVLLALRRASRGVYLHFRMQVER